MKYFLSKYLYELDDAFHPKVVSMYDIKGTTLTSSYALFTFSCKNGNTGVKLTFFYTKSWALQNL
jgi:hypothetical protein